MTAETKTTSTGNGEGARPDEAADAGASAWMAFWLQGMEQAGRGTQALLEAAQSAGDPARLQRHWADAMSEAADGFMRTPAFLEAMRRNLKNLTEAKKAQDGLVRDTARHLGLPLAEDISGLFERLDGTERRILAKLEAIEGRLAALEAGGAPRAPRAAGPGPKGKPRSS